jgi:formylglycine-generating enzyme required for sulfatase activity
LSSCRSLLPLSFALAVILAGCRQGDPVAAATRTVEAPTPEAIALPERERLQVAPPVVPVRAGAWTLPAAVLEQPSQIAAAKRQAAIALEEGRLYRTADDAIPLYRAILALKPNDRVAQRALQRIQKALLVDIEALLRQQHEQRAALTRATELSVVALALEPDGEAELALHERIEQARTVVALNRAGEAELRQGRIGEVGSAAEAKFREALALDPESTRARQGLAAVESALIRRAEDAASQADFAQVERWLVRAQRIREAEAPLADARARIELMRQAQIVALRDAGMRDLQTPIGLRAAREKLDQALQIALPADPVVLEFRNRIDLATHYGSFRPGQVFSDGLRDGGRGPQMIVVPHGGFRMGAGADEPGASDSELPQHYVRFERGFAMAITEVTVADFGRFVAATGARPRATRRGHSLVYDERGGNFVRHSGVDWRSGYNAVPAAANSPVMHVSVRDAEAFAAWLSEQTGRHYRLPSEAEFEYALRAGTSGRYPWGNRSAPPEGAGNLTGGLDVSPGGRRWHNGFVGYGDGFWGPAPVASFQANAWGLHDMSGNLSEWVADCWHASYRRAPTDGVAWYNPGCRQRLVRGANWANSPEQSRAAWRWSQDSDVTSARIGFRLVRVI